MKPAAGDWMGISLPRETVIASLAAAGIAVHFCLRFSYPGHAAALVLPLYAVVAGGGIPLASELVKKIRAGEAAVDLLAWVSIGTAVFMGQPLVAAILVLMLSGGAALEQFAARRASSVLQALARRMPQTAHRRAPAGIEDIALAQIAVGDTLVVFPHEVCPADGVVTEGYSTMDEAYLTGEPFVISKAPGTQVISGAINGEAALTISAQKLAVDSRYAKIVRVMEAAENDRPRLRRLADRLAAWYVPAALIAAGAAWFFTGDPVRFLAVLVVATPCPLLIAIPVAVIGAISLSARRGIIIKNPAILEQIAECRSLIFDKTGTLTSGKPALTEVVCASGFARDEVLRAAASLEQYSKHPLAGAILSAAPRPIDAAASVSESPGQGLSGVVAGRRIRITGRAKTDDADPALPPPSPGLECLVFIEGRFAAAFHFHDIPRVESRPFLMHLPHLHEVTKVMLISGDREAAVRYLAEAVGISDFHFGKSPEEKVALVAEETRRAKTLFVGDGINDAPALRTATVGLAFGSNSDVTSEAADAVIMTPDIGKVDELLHIGRRMRRIALESAVGGMALSLIAMAAAAAGRLPPVEGAVAQELIDLAAVLNAVRVAWQPRSLTDF